MLLLLVCSPSSALSLEESGNAAKTLALELEKESDVAASSAVLATTSLVESSVPQEPQEPVVVDAGRANMEIKPPMGERTASEEGSLEIPTGKLI
jgi:hypothetical protein